MLTIARPAGPGGKAPPAAEVTTRSPAQKLGAMGAGKATAGCPSCRPPGSPGRESARSTTGIRLLMSVSSRTRAERSPTSATRPTSPSPVSGGLTLAHPVARAGGDQDAAHEGAAIVGHDPGGDEGRAWARAQTSAARAGPRSRPASWRATVCHCSSRSCSLAQRRVLLPETPEILARCHRLGGRLARGRAMPSMIGDRASTSRAAGRARRASCPPCRAPSGPRPRRTAARR